MRRGLGDDRVPPQFQTALDRALAPFYSGISRTAIEEAEGRYGPFALGFVLGTFAFLVYLGRVVHRKIQ